MNFSNFRTKYFPLLSAATALLFVGLFFMFYQLVFSAMYDILDEQNRRLLSRLASTITDTQTDLERETKVLYASRSVRKRMSAVANGGPDIEVASKLRSSVRSWSTNIGNEH